MKYLKADLNQMENKDNNNNFVYGLGIGINIISIKKLFNDDRISYINIDLITSYNSESKFTNYLDKSIVYTGIGESRKLTPHKINTTSNSNMSFEFRLSFSL